MHRLVPVALATLLAATAPAHLHAQTSPSPAQFTDPANLRGERVSPRTGRELPIDQGTLGLEELLRKLSTRASILNIVAHPDDEDGGMLTLYSRGFGARVADISLTRGEGGQNAMTGDFEDALGLLRTQELLSNDRYTGVTQMFGTEVDFGFSKTKSEAFAKWDHQRVLYDVVRAIRLYRPLVLTATFIGNPTDGHGQHQVSGEIAQEAFLAAGDPNVFPELTREGILPWQPLKMYARVPMQAISDKGLFDYATGQYVPAEFTNYITGKTSSTPPTADIVIHEGTVDPLLTTCAANASDLPPQLKPTAAGTTDCRSLSYVQFARIGLGLQRTQIGPGVRNAASGRFDVPYHLYGSCVGPSADHSCHATTSSSEKRIESEKAKTPITNLPNFFDGIDTSIRGIADLAHDAPESLIRPLDILMDLIDNAAAHFSPSQPSAIAPTLAQALQATDSILKSLPTLRLSPLETANIAHELRIRRVQLNDALALAYGVAIDAKSEAQNSVYAHHAVHVRVDLTASADTNCSVKKTWLENAVGISSEGNYGKKPGPRSLGAAPYSELLIVINQKDPFATAFSGTVTRPYFERSNIEQPVYQLRDLSLRSAPQSPPAFRAWAAIQCGASEFQVARIVHGPLDLQPVDIIPSLNISLSEHARVLPIGTHNFTITETDRSFGSRAYLLNVCLPTGCKFPYSPSENSSRVYKIDVPKTLWGQNFNVTTQGFNADQNPSLVKDPEGFRPVGYGDLPRTNYYTPATDRIVPVDLKLPPPDKRRIAYLPGTGDDVPAALASIGLAPTLLKVADLTPAKLSNFDTVILGVRTYNAHPDLHGAPTQALLDFARNGGNVVIQYQTYEFTAADAPFPLELGRAEKVVDETAPVVLLTTENSQLKTDSQTRFAEELLTTPNRITPADFNHWIEERGHGFLSSWDPHYIALTETHDPGAPSEHVQPQAPQRGGLITVQLGKGRWTYCAFALYRQLPEAVPGAFRIFVNLLNP